MHPTWKREWWRRTIAPTSWRSISRRRRRTPPSIGTRRPRFVQGEGVELLPSIRSPFYNRPVVSDRVPCAAQRETVRRRHGIAAETTLGDPGSAAHHFVLCCARETRTSA